MSATPAPPPGATPAELMTWIFGMHNAHDPHAIGPVVAPDAVVRLPTRTLRGRDEVVAYFLDLYAALPDAAFTLLAVVGEGESVLVRWRLAGTHSAAPFEGLEPTGRRVDIDGVDHVTIRDEMVTANFVIYDRMQFARGLGLLPAEGSRLEVGLRTAFNALARRRR